MELLHPITGEVIDTADVDALIEAADAAQHQISALIAFKAAAVRALVGHLSPADLVSGTRTCRIRGNRLRAKIETPPDVFDQPALKDLWEKYAMYACPVIAIERLRVNMREYKKIMNESGPADFQKFRAALIAANCGPVGTPQVTKEEDC